MDSDHERYLLAEYLSFLTDDLGLDVVISDMSGILDAHPPLNQVFQPYKSHKNPYCMYVKNNQTLWSQCIILKEKLMQRCQARPAGFFGTCHCGVGEYVLPIVCQGRLTGFLSATGYRTDLDRLERRLPITAHRFALEETILRDLYDAHMREPVGNTARIIMHLSLVARMLTDWIEKKTVDAGAEDCIQIQSGKLIARALDFMNEMYANPIELAEIARYCACSKSHLQHLFQQIRGKTVWETLLEIRMDKARRLLHETDLPIYNLAAMVGFNDANYFSTVFSRIHHQSPRQYRQEWRQAAPGRLIASESSRQGGSGRTATDKPKGGPAWPTL